MNVRRACLTIATLLASGVLVAVAAPLGADAASVSAPAMSTNALVTVPDVVDLTGNSAAAKLRAVGLKYHLTGTGGFVARQSPLAHSQVPGGTTVDLVMTEYRH